MVCILLPVTLSDFRLLSQIDTLLRGAAEVIQREDLAEKLKENRPLRIKAGFDPTAPDLHLGHMVLLNKMAAFQQYGHQVIFLIGDFTGMLGDPSGRNSMRPQLSREEIERNAQTYRNQVFSILDEKLTEIRFNSEWTDPLDATKVVELASTYTLARMLERDDFSKRYRSQQPISLHEFLYPVFQGYDSVALHADVELGGTDQKFNLLVGREIQRHFQQPEQVVMTLPLLEGLDGVQKMSKSLDNYVGLHDAPEEMYGKLMSVSDDLMWRYFNLLSERDNAELARLQDEVAAGKNPRDVKMELAFEITERLHNKRDADAAQDNFVRRFSKRQSPENVALQELAVDAGGIGLAQLLKQLGLVSSTSDGLRMIRQGAVRIASGRISDTDAKLSANKEPYLIEVGKRRVARVLLTTPDQT